MAKNVFGYDKKHYYSIDTSNVKDYVKQYTPKGFTPYEKPLPEPETSILDNVYGVANDVWDAVSENAGPILETAKNEFGDFFGAGPAYKKSLSDNKSIFLSPEVADIKDNNGVLDVVYNKEKAEELFVSKIDEFVKSKSLHPSLARDAKLRVGVEESNDPGERTDDMFSRLFQWTNRFMNLNDDDHEYISGLIDAFIETDDALRTLEEAKSQKDYGKETETEKGYTGDIISKFSGVRQAASLISDVFGIDNAGRRRIDNVFYNAANVLTSAANLPGKYVDVNYIDYQTIKEKTRQIMSDKIAAMPETTPEEVQAKQEAVKRLQDKAASESDIEFAKELGLQFSDLIGSMRWGGSIDLALRGVNNAAPAVNKGFDAINKSFANHTNNKLQRIGKFLTRIDEQKIIDLERKLESNRTLKGTMKMLWDGLSSKNLKYKDVIIPSIQNFGGTVASNTTKMAIAVGMTNALDLGMSTEEAWESTSNLSMLIGMNTAFGNALSRSARAIKLANGSIGRYALNPSAYVNNLEKIYTALGFAGEVLSQGTMNHINGLDPFSREALGEHLLNFGFGYHSFKAFKRMNDIDIANKYKDKDGEVKIKPDYSNTEAFKEKVVTPEVFGKMNEDDVIEMKSIINDQGEVMNVPVTYVQNDTPGDLIRKGARDLELSMDNLTAKNVFDMLKDQHSYLPKSRQSAMEKLINKVGNTKVVVENVDKPHQALYKPPTDEIVFNENEMTIGYDYQKAYDDLSEEALHTLTVHGYKKVPSIKEATDKLYNKIVSKVDLDKAEETLDPDTYDMLEYHLQNPHETMALFMNRKLENVRDYVLKEINLQDPTKGIRGALKRYLGGKDKETQAEFDSIFKDLIENKSLFAPEQTQDVNTTETMPNDINSQQTASVGEINPFEQDAGIGFDPDEDMLGAFVDKLNANIDGEVRVDNAKYETNAVKNIYSALKEYNQEATKLGLNVGGFKTLDDFIFDAHRLYDKPVTMKELGEYIKKQVPALKDYRDHINTVAKEIVNINEGTSNRVEYQDNTGEHVNLKQIFDAINTDQVLSLYAAKSSDSIRPDIIKYLNKHDKAYTEEEKNRIADYYSNYLSNLKQYETLVLNDKGLLEPNSLQTIKGKPTAYYDGRMTGFEKFVSNFKMDGFYTNNAKLLMTDLFKNDVQVVIGDINGDLSSSQAFKGLLKNDEPLRLLKQGYYIIPRGEKSHSVMYSHKLKQIANNPELAVSVTKSLMKGNFYKHLDSDATWGYKLERPNLGIFAQHVKHDKLVEWASGKQISPEELATRPDSVKLLTENKDALIALRNKAKQYYTNHRGIVQTLEHIKHDPENELNHLTNLANAITGVMAFAVDPSGTSFTFKFDEQNNFIAKKAPFKYEGLPFGRSPRQLNKEEYIRTYVDPGKKASSPQDLYSLYKEIGLNYKNGNLYQKTIVIDPAIFAEHPTLGKIFGNEKTTDGASFSLNSKLHALYNRIMLNKKDESVLKPRFYDYDEQGNGVLWKTALFDMIPDLDMKQSNPDYSMFIDNISKYAGVLSFNSALKSGHTYRVGRVLSSINPDAYIVVNHLKQPISAEVNGKEDLELFEQEYELYKADLLQGKVHEKYMLEIPVTGDNPIQLIGASHEGKSGRAEAGSLGIHNLPMFNDKYEFWQGDDGKARSIMQKYVKNIISGHLKGVEGLNLLRRVIKETDKGFAYNKLSYEDRLKAGRALVILSRELERIPESDDSYDSVNNMGITNFQNFIQNALDNDGALRLSYIKPLLVFDRFIAGQQGAHPGTGSLIQHAMKRKLQDAHKVRLEGSNLVVTPDVASKSDFQRLYKYEKNKDYYNELTDEKAAVLYSKHFDEELGVYKDLSQGVSLPYEVIRDNDLKLGDKVFVKLTPTDDLHSFVPMILTGMTKGSGTMTANTKYLTEVMGRDFDKDNLQVVLPGRQINKKDFNYLWNYFTKQGIPTGKYKSGIDQVGNILGFPDSKESMHIPSSKNYYRDMIDSHIGQGDGIAFMNTVGQAFSNIEFGSDSNKLLAQISGAKENHVLEIDNGWVNAEGVSLQPLAATTSKVKQDFVDTYDTKTYDPKNQFLKTMFPYSQNLKDAYKQLRQIGLMVSSSFENANSLDKLTPSLEIPDDIKDKVNKSSNALFLEGLQTLDIDNTLATENARYKLLGDARRIIEQDLSTMDLGSRKQEILDDIAVIKNILGPQFYKLTRKISFDYIQANDKRTEEHAAAIRSKLGNEAKANVERPLRLASQLNFDTVPEYQSLFGVIFREYANTFRHAPIPYKELYVAKDGRAITYSHNGMEGYIQVANKNISIKHIFDNEGTLLVPELKMIDKFILKKLGSAGLFNIDKGFSDSEKSRLVGKMVGALGYAKGYGENKIGYIAFANVDGTSIGLPNPKHEFGLLSEREAEIANVEAGVRSIGGLVPTINKTSAQQYVIDKLIQDERLKFADSEAQGLPTLPEQSSEANDVAQVGDIPNELGSFNPMNKNRDKVRKIKKDIANELGLDWKKIDLSKLSNEEWDLVNEKVLTPYVKDKLNLNSFPNKEARDMFIDEFIQQHTAGAINNVKKYFDLKTLQGAKEAEIEVKLDENGNRIYTDSINQTIKNMKNNFLNEFVYNIDKLNRRTSDSFYTNYQVFKDTSKYMLINENSKLKKTYLANEKIYPQFALKDGQLKQSDPDELGFVSPEYNYVTVGDQFDKKLLLNKANPVFAKHYIEKILPLNAYNVLRDTTSVFLKDKDQELFNAPFIDTMPKAVKLNFDNNELKPLFALIKNRLTYNREYNIQPKDGMVTYEDSKGQKASSTLKNINNIKEIIKKDYLDLRHLTVSPEGIDPKIAEAELKLILPAVEAYVKTNLVAKHTSDLLRDAKFKLEDQVKRYNDPNIQDMLNTQINELEAEINALDSNQPKVLFNRTRGLKISSEVAMQLVDDFINNPRKNSLERHTELRQQHSDYYGRSQGAHGILKSAIDQSISKNIEPNIDILLDQKIKKQNNKGELYELDETIRDRYLKNGFTPEEISNITRELVEYSKLTHNEMGEWYEGLRKAKLYNLTIPWKELKSDERSELSTFINTEIKKVIRNYKDQAKVNNKVYTLLGYIPDDIKVKENLDIETLLSAFLPESRHDEVFEYSINNLNNKTSKLLNKTVYALQKAMNIDYLKNPDPNNVVHNEILSEFASTTGSDFVYNTEYDLPEIRNLARMVEEGNEIGIAPGKPIFALYRDRNGEMRQNIGRYLNSFMKPVYDQHGNIKKQIPYFTMIDDTSNKIKIYTMPYYNMTNLVEGEAIHATMRMHNRKMSKKYKAFGQQIMSDLKTLATEEYNVEKGVNFRVDKKLRDAAEMKIETNAYDFQSDVNKGSAYSKYNDFMHNALIKSQVITSYGFGKYFLNAAAGLITMPISPTIGFGLLAKGIGGGIIRYYGKVVLSNKLGTSGFSQSTGYGPELDSRSNLWYSIVNMNKSLNRALKANPDSAESVTAKVITAGIQKSNENTVAQIDALVNLENRVDMKTGNANSWELIKKRKEFSKQREALEEMERIIKNMNVDFELNQKLKKSIQDQFNKTYSKLGKKITISNDGIPFIDGKSLIEVGGIKYNIMDQMLNLSLLNGKMAEFEQEAAANTIVVQEKQLQDIVERYRMIDDATKRSINVSDALVNSFLMTTKDIAIGDYKKTIQSKGIPGRMLTMFRGFGKGNAMNHTVNRVERENFFRGLQETMNGDKEFKKYLKSKADIPYLDFSIKSGKKDILADLYLKGIFAGLGTAVFTLIYNLWNDDDMPGIVREVGYNLSRETEDQILYNYAVNTSISNLATAGVLIANDIVNMEKGNVNKQSQLGNQAIRKLSEVTSGFAGKGQNDFIELAYILGVTGMYMNFLEDNSSKKALGNMVEKRAVRTAQRASNYVIPGANDLLITPLIELSKDK